MFVEQKNVLKLEQITEIILELKDKYADYAAQISEVGYKLLSAFHPAEQPQPEEVHDEGLDTEQEE